MNHVAEMQRLAAVLLERIENAPTDERTELDRWRGVYLVACDIKTHAQQQWEERKRHYATPLGPQPAPKPTTHRTCNYCWRPEERAGMCESCLMSRGA